MRNHREVIDLWPSRPDFARAIGVSTNTAQAWHRRNCIPAFYWLRVRDKAHALGHSVSIEDLCEMLANAKSRKNVRRESFTRAEAAA
jgi:hypothetical protein